MRPNMNYELTDKSVLQFGRVKAEYCSSFKVETASSKGSTCSVVIL